MVICMCMHVFGDDAMSHLTTHFPHLFGQEVDEAHFGYSFKYLKNKPVKELSGEQFLKMCLAEEEGLLTIDICIDLMGIKGYGHV